ncbi:hypothetical protein SLEP1_g15864 [Rubroshorea leprosula]|uniref:Uncharacterized protein n=1 Tax=Rubroshorea leprosula TaxID=152421 RepID=A0AAV5IUL8_9ROSI|nr:hypothetical protein SLEP1_g15864 [Rubroshorea leprosula]
MRSITLGLLKCTPAIRRHRTLPQEHTEGRILGYKKTARKMH